jgi:hypothetical protein
MTPNVFDRVALLRAVLEANVHAGDVATLVDFVDHPTGGEQGAILEIFNALGDSFGVITVPLSAIEALRADEMPCVRPLAKTRQRRRAD